MNKFDSTAWLLEQWAHWAASDRGQQLGFPNQTPVRRLLGSTVRSPAISDLVAGEIDRAVAQLCESEPDAGRAVVLHYVRRLSYHQVGERMRIDRRQANALVKSGVTRVGEVLDDE